jgi:hypothetical protein
MIWSELIKQITELGFNTVNNEYDDRYSELIKQIHELELNPPDGENTSYYDKHSKLIQQIHELGLHEYDDIYSEDKYLYILSVNRAIELIASTVRPIIGEYVITYKTKHKYRGDYAEYDIAYLINSSSCGYKFYDFADDPPMIELTDGDYLKLAGYQTQSRRLLLVPPDVGYGKDASSFSKIHVFYKKKPTPITLETPKDFEIELDYDVQLLLPLLASHYVWLDDEPAKAHLYYNQYEIMKNQILANSANTISKTKLVNTTGWWK